MRIYSLYVAAMFLIVAIGCDASPIEKSTEAEDILELTPEAAAEIKQITSSDSELEGAYLRVAIKKQDEGCPFTYSMNFDRQYDPTNDQLFESYGIPIVIDRQSAPYLDGTTISFEDNMDGKRGFRFNNPHTVRVSDN